METKWWRQNSEQKKSRPSWKFSPPSSLFNKKHRGDQESSMEGVAYCSVKSERLTRVAVVQQFSPISVFLFTFVILITGRHRTDKFDYRIDKFDYTSSNFCDPFFPSHWEVSDPAHYTNTKLVIRVIASTFKLYRLRYCERTG